MADEWVELCALLSEDKVKGNIEPFFTELYSFLSQMDSGEPFDNVSLAAPTHQQRGAAAMLGPHDLANRLADLEDVARQDPVFDLAPWVSDLTAIADPSPMACKTSFQNDTKTHPLV